MIMYLLLQQFALVDILYIMFDFRTDLINFGENGHLRNPCQENRKLQREPITVTLSKLSTAAVLFEDGNYNRGECLMLK